MPINKQTSLSSATEAQEAPSKLKSFVSSVAAPAAVVASTFAATAAKAADTAEAITATYTGFSLATLPTGTMVTIAGVLLGAGVTLKLLYNSGTFVKKATNLAKG